MHVRSYGAHAGRLIAVGACAGALLGCNQDSQLAQFRANPTPRLVTLTQTAEDANNALTIKADTDLRSFNRDLGWAFHLDRPSRLTPIQIPY